MWSRCDLKRPRLARCPVVLGGLVLMLASRLLSLFPRRLACHRLHHVVGAPVDLLQLGFPLLTADVDPGQDTTEVTGQVTLTLVVGHGEQIDIGHRAPARGARLPTMRSRIVSMRPS